VLPRRRPPRREAAQFGGGHHRVVRQLRPGKKTELGPRATPEPVEERRTDADPVAGGLRPMGRFSAGDPLAEIDHSCRTSCAISNKQRSAAPLQTEHPDRR
jgi:hypothetical protein